MKGIESALVRWNEDAQQWDWQIWDEDGFDAKGILPGELNKEASNDELYGAFNSRIKSTVTNGITIKR